MAKSPALKELRPRMRMEFDPDCKLDALDREIMAYLIEGELTLDEIAEVTGRGEVTIWRRRSTEAFKQEYRKQLRKVEETAIDLAISRRIERLQVLNETWLALRARIKKHGPRNDLVYSMLAIHADARKELGQEVHRLEVTQAISVIRFEALEPRTESSDDVVDAEFVEFAALPEPTDDERFAQALQAAGIRIDSGKAQPEELASIREAIEERGLAARDVLSDSQFERIYGRAKEVDPWS